MGGLIIFYYVVVGVFFNLKYIVKFWEKFMGYKVWEVDEVYKVVIVFVEKVLFYFNLLVG